MLLDMHIIPPLWYYNRMNIAFIDTQNLHLGTKTEGWIADHKKLRIYLRDKYNIQEAYCFFGYTKVEYATLYSRLQRVGYIVQFKESNEEMASQKKGNVDVDLVFYAMEALIERDDFEKIFIVSGDGDYYRLIRYFINKKRFGRILFPNKNRSSLYKRIADEYIVYLSTIKHKIAYLN